MALVEGMRGSGAGELGSPSSSPVAVSGDPASGPAQVAAVRPNAARGRVVRVNDGHVTQDDVFGDCPYVLGSAPFIASVPHYVGQAYLPYSTGRGSVKPLSPGPHLGAPRTLHRHR